MVAFEPSALTAGFGAVWAAHDQWPVLVRIDPATRRGEIFASFPDGAAPAASAAPDWPPGPGAIAAGGGAVWLALSDRDQLLRVDPVSREVRAVDLPFGPSEIGAGPAGVVAIGPAGDGRLAVVSPAGEVTVAEVGRSLRLAAVADELAWTVDDAAAAVLALDVRSLEPVAVFPHRGSPDALLARGDRAWYASGREIEIAAAGQLSERAIIWSGGPAIDLLRLDAATGEKTRLGQLSGDIAVLADDGLWVSGRCDDPVDESAADCAGGYEHDPVTSLHHYDRSGALLGSVSLPGQIGELAVCDGQLWVSGFRRSRQADVLSVLSRDGALAGEADLGGVDITPWYTPPEPPVRYPPGEFAERARAAAEASLTGPHQAVGRLGETWLEPPVDPAFSLEQVGLRPAREGYEITVTFRWAGEDGLLGFASPVAQDDDWPATPAEAGGAVCIYLEENLRGGAGLESAIREPGDGVSWLRWAEPGPDEPPEDEPGDGTFSWLSGDDPRAAGPGEPAPE